jgi:hypothetical protein
LSEQIDTSTITKALTVKQIDGGCSKRRPDLLYDMYTHVIIVENDENSHKTYDEICENKRMMQLFEDLGNRPIVFIRFDCGNYIKNGGGN